MQNQTTSAGLRRWPVVKLCLPLVIGAVCLWLVQQQLGAGAPAEIGHALARLIARRLVALEGRAADESEFPGPIHVERIVLGARLGLLWRDERSRPHFAGEAARHLDELFTQAASRGFAAARYRAPGGGLRPDLIVPSVLRAAPAIGAAVQALNSHAQSPAS